MGMDQRNWLDLPDDVTTNILDRLSVVEILENAQKVCTAWRKICKDPAMWRVIDMENLQGLANPRALEKMCMNVIDRSQGQLVDLSIEHFPTDDLIEFLAQGERYGLLFCVFHQDFVSVFVIRNLFDFDFLDFMLCACC